MISVLFLLMHLLFACLILFLTLSFFTGAPYVPSSRQVTRRMIEFGRIGSRSTVVDLGSGDGRLLFAAAAAGATAIGYEINPFLVLLTRLKALAYRTPGKVTVYWRNFWRADVAGADTVFVYLIPAKMDRLARKLERQLKPGALVVSNSFIFPQWPIQAQDPGRHVYAFRMPRRRAIMTGHGSDQV